LISGFLSNPDNIKKIMPMLEKIGLNFNTGNDEQPANTQL